MLNRDAALASSVADLVDDEAVALMSPKPWSKYRVSSCVAVAKWNPAKTCPGRISVFTALGEKL